MVLVPAHRVRVSRQVAMPQIHQQEREIVERVNARNLIIELHRIEQGRLIVEHNDAQLAIGLFLAGALHRTQYPWRRLPMPAIAAESIAIPIGGGEQIGADLRVPHRATGLVVFAHGSGSSRFSSRNRAVAKTLQNRGLGTLLLDLLTREEERVDLRTTEYRFDIGRLGKRVVAATDWLQNREDTRWLRIGCFGASTGAAAALIAAAERSALVHAVVSRGGRPDLAGAALPRVKAPTLLIVGGEDEPVIDLNQEAKAQMQAAHVELKIVPGATHLFEEPGTLEQVEQLAGDWFVGYLRRSA
jgi:putative phosphoribosyl transferase